VARNRPQPSTPTAPDASPKPTQPPTHPSPPPQFYITLGDEAPSLDEKKTIFGSIAEGLEVLEAIGDAFVDDAGRPYQNIRCGVGRGGSPARRADGGSAAARWLTPARRGRLGPPSAADGARTRAPSPRARPDPLPAARPRSIRHTHVLEDPFDDPPRLEEHIPDASPEPQFEHVRPSGGVQARSLLQGGVAPEPGPEPELRLAAAL
jgi:hypothetical protein